MKTFRSLALTVLLVVTPHLAFAQDTIYHLSMVTAVAAHGADLATTENCLGAGKCYEMNPWLARYDQPAVFGAVKMGFAAGQLWFVNYLRGKLPANRRWLATTVNFATTVAFSGVAYHNAAVLSR